MAPPWRRREKATTAQRSTRLRPGRCANATTPNRRPGRTTCAICQTTISPAWISAHCACLSGKVSIFGSTSTRRSRSSRRPSPAPMARCSSACSPLLATKESGTTCGPRSGSRSPPKADQPRTSPRVRSARSFEERSKDPRARCQFGSSESTVRAGSCARCWSGPIAVNATKAAPFEDALRAIVVVRGSEPLPVREPVPLQLPKEAADQLGAGQPSPADS